MLNDDSYVVANNLPLARRAGEGVLANDTDPSGDLTIADPGGYDTTEGGTIYLARDGSFVYLAKNGFSGTDTFEYTAENDIGGQASATITFEVIASANQPDIHLRDTSLTGTLLDPGQAKIPQSDVLAAGVPVALSGGGYVVVAHAAGWTGFGLIQAYDANGAAVGSQFRIEEDTGVAGVAVVATGDGYIAAWREGGIESDEWPVQVQIFDQGGNPLGTTLTMFPGDVLDNAPRLMTLADGNVAVLIEEEGVGTVAQIISPEGDLVGGKFTLAGPPVDGAVALSQIADDLGGFWQLWTQEGVDGSSLWMQRLDAEGTAIGAKIEVVEGAEGALAGSLALSGDGDLIVTWTDYTSSPSAANVHARSFDADGAPQGAEFVSSDFFWGTLFGPPVSQRAFALSGGGYVVAWEHDIEPFGTSAVDRGEPAGLRRAISAVVFDAEGHAVSDEILVYAVQSQTEYGSVRLRPYITPLADGGFVIAAHEYDRSGPDTNVVLYSFDQFGNRVGNEALINGSATGIQLWPSVALLADGRLVGVWSGGADDDGYVGSQILDVVDVVARQEGQGPLTIPLSVTVIEAVGATSPDTAVRIVVEGLPPGSVLTPPPGMTATFDAGSGKWTLAGTIPDSFDLIVDLPKFFHGDVTLLATVYARDVNGTAEVASAPLALRLEIADVAAVIVGTPGKDIVDGVVTVAGQDVASPLGDSIEGNGGADTLSGLDGDDMIDGGQGSDRLDGGAGDDILLGKRGRDDLRGGDDDDAIAGGRGGDTVDGGAGNDWIDGGRGSNRLTGGDGGDTFVFTRISRPDKITDFGPGDVIALSGSKFAGIGPAGPLQAGYFHAGAEAESKDQKILYDGGTGWVLYARDGSKTATPLKLVKIGKGLADFDAGDVIVI